MPANIIQQVVVINGVPASRAPSVVRADAAGRLWRAGCGAGQRLCHSTCVGPRRGCMHHNCRNAPHCTNVRGGTHAKGCTLMRRRNSGRAEADKDGADGAPRPSAGRTWHEEAADAASGRNVGSAPGARFKQRRFCSRTTSHLAGESAGVAFQETWRATARPNAASQHLHAPRTKSGRSPKVLRARMSCESKVPGRPDRKSHRWPESSSRIREPSADFGSDAQKKRSRADTLAVGRERGVST